MPSDQRLIEDYIPIEAISAESRREKSIRKGHISTLHLWWARRPLVASRAAVYGALVPAPKDSRSAKETSDFVARLCKYPGNPELIAQAETHILEAHAQRLTEESGSLVTVEDIRAGRAPRPKVLDMFAGGGAIPLEALRLGCQAYALDLNPVAHIVELCTLVYPQKYGQPDSSVKGSAKDGTWAGLAEEVAYWGKWVLKRVKAEIGDLYPPIPDPTVMKQENGPKQLGMNLAVKEDRRHYSEGLLTPVAYLWTRTVTCKNPSCRATVPLARQTWLAKKKGRYIALKPIVNPETPAGIARKVKYQVVEATTEKGLGFDPKTGSKGGNASCPFCGTVNDSTYVKAEGQAGRIEVQPMAVVCTRPKERGKVYLSVDEVPLKSWPDGVEIWKRIFQIENESQDGPSGSINVPTEKIVNDAKGSAWIVDYGYDEFGKLFTDRQSLVLLTFTKWTHLAYEELSHRNYQGEYNRVIATYLGVMISRFSDYCSSLCTLNNTGGRGTAHTFTRQALPMVWDFAESYPFNEIGANWQASINAAVSTINRLPKNNPAIVVRGSATHLDHEPNSLDAVVTDPPYYDNVPYSNIADYFFVWLKRSIGFLYPEHFSSELTPKKHEAVADATRHGRDRQLAASAYENMMFSAFTEAGRVLKHNAPLIVVYAHKTTLAWATLVDALRQANFTVTEAWPLDTEKTGRLRDQNSAALASSIFLVARRREKDETGSYENDVRPTLEKIVRERVERLWAQGVTGADLVIACVGAGLRAFTRYAQVEYANGQPVPAETYLTEVEGVVLESLLEKLFGVSGGGVGRVDPVTRFYILWRYAYHHAALDAGEAIVFAYPQRVELDGPGGLTSGANPLVVKDRGKYTLLDFVPRGSHEKLGLPDENGNLPPLVDVLHRLLYLVEHQPAIIPAYLDEAHPDLEHLRLVAQTLAGQTLAGNGAGGGRSLVAARGAEAAALRKLTTNWKSLILERHGKLI